MQRSGSHSYNQFACFKSHKRSHFLPYQTLNTSDGLIFALFGSVERRRHDLTLLRNSGWETVLVGILTTAGRQFYIYRDQEYMLRPWMIRPFIVDLSQVEATFNEKMSTILVTVEHNSRT